MIPQKRATLKKLSNNTEAAIQRCSFSNAISVKYIEITLIENNFIEITLRPGRFPINLLHSFRTTFPKNTSERLLLK